MCRIIAVLSLSMKFRKLRTIDARYCLSWSQDICEKITVLRKRWWRQWQQWKWMLMGRHTHTNTNKYTYVFYNAIRNCENPKTTVNEIANGKLSSSNCNDSYLRLQWRSSPLGQSHQRQPLWKLYLKETKRKLPENVSREFTFETEMIVERTLNAKVVFFFRIDENDNTILIVCGRLTDERCKRECLAIVRWRNKQSSKFKFLNSDDRTLQKCHGTAKYN